jgi:hypothetical protein
VYTHHFANNSSPPRVSLILVLDAAEEPLFGDEQETSPLTSIRRPRMIDLSSSGRCGCSRRSPVSADIVAPTFASWVQLSYLAQALNPQSSSTT